MLTQLREVFNRIQFQVHGVFVSDPSEHLITPLLPTHSHLIPFHPLYSLIYQAGSSPSKPLTSRGVAPGAPKRQHQKRGFFAPLSTTNQHLYFSIPGCLLPTILNRYTSGICINYMYSKKEMPLCYSQVQSPS